MIKENNTDEARLLPQQSMNRVQDAMDKYAQQVYGDKYNTKNEK